MVYVWNSLVNLRINNSLNR